MNDKIGITMLLLVSALATAVVFVQCGPIDPIVRSADSVSRPPAISPDYCGITIPPNIAPLNFRIREAGISSLARIYSTHGDTISVFGRRGAIRIPPRRWHELLVANPGEPMTISIYNKDSSGKWTRFPPLRDTIAADNIDGYLAYRLIDPLYELWDDMGIYQRDLHSFDESCVLDNKTLYNVPPKKFDSPVTKACMNCHTFFNKSCEKMVVHIRGGPGTGMVLVNNGTIEKIDTRTLFNKSPGAYTSWHPSGALLAMTVMSVHQFFHGLGRVRDVIDTKSDIVLYDITTNTIKTSPLIASASAMETYPEWSPDGCFLYFCSAPQLDSTFTIYGPEAEYAKVKYSLMRIAFDYKSNTWGKLDTVLSASTAGMSVSHPKISPDGKCVIFCMANYGNFPVHAPESDLYIMDISTRQYRRMEINSNCTESYHSWSKNGRWIVFSSKRDSSTCARPYFSYFDKAGKEHKPFLLPQEDPDYYDSFFKTYNVPEFTIDRIKPHWRELAEAAQGKKGMIKANLDKMVPVDGISKPTPKVKNLPSAPY